MSDEQKQAEDHEAGVTPEMVDAARAAYREYESITLALYSEAWQFARMRAALVAALSHCPSPTERIQT